MPKKSPEIKITIPSFVVNLTQEEILDMNDLLELINDKAYDAARESVDELMKPVTKAVQAMVKKEIKAFTPEKLEKMAKEIAAKRIKALL